MIGEHNAFKTLALGVASVALIGAIGAGDANHYARFVFGKGKKSQVVSPTPTPTPTTTTTSSTPTPTPTTTTTTTTSNFSYPEESAVTSEFDVNSELIPSWGTGQIPSPATDNTGAFRFICTAGQLLADDPIVMPGQPGKSHLHQFYGNLDANAYSTYSSLRSSGKSSCVSPVNRSAYWMPAMLDGVGHVVRPDYISIYYKRGPQSASYCSLTSGDPKAVGNCIPLPNGLRYQFGHNMLDPSDTSGTAYFDCDGATAPGGHFATLEEAVSKCPTAANPDGSHNRLGAVIVAPSCWDGKNLDSADHRSHMGYFSYGWWGYQKCDDAHPFVIPTFTMAAWYTVDANLGTWRLSSDPAGGVRGSTLHADWFGAWDNKVESMWMANCINKELNCSGGDLGNGLQMKSYDGFSFNASPRLVAIP